MDPNGVIVLEVDWRSGGKASRARNFRKLKRLLEKRVKQYLDEHGHGECDERVKGRLRHFVKQYEKMHWLAVVPRRTTVSGSPRT